MQAEGNNGLETESNRQTDRMVSRQAVSQREAKERQAAGQTDRAM